MRLQALRWMIIATVLLCLSPFTAFAGEEGSPKAEPVAKEPIPFKTQRTPEAGSLVRVLLVSLLAVGGGVGSAVVLKRNLQKKGVISAVQGTRIKVSETKPISPKMTMFLVAVDGKDYLLVRSADQIQITPHERSAGTESEHDS